MKFKLDNNKLPPINSIILVCKDDSNVIGLVEAVANDNIVVLMLDRIGRIIIHISDNWTQLNVSNLSSLRYVYKVFINQNIDGILNESYLKFKNNYIKK
jgi:hypothetical protein